MLSSYTRSLVNKPTPSIDAESPVELLLRKSIATYLDSSHSFTEEFLWMVANLTSGYLNELISSLHKYTEMQRKSKPSKSDAQLVLNQHSITPNKLFDQFEKQKEFKNRSEIDKLEKKTISLIDPHKDVEYSQDEPSLLFFTNENYEITELVPKKFAKPDYVPYFLPDLPPDYTYQKTPRYMDRITDLKEMRLKLVEESRLTEKSLYSLIDDEDIKWKEKFEMELLELEKAQEREIEREAEKEYDEKSDGEDSVMSEHPEIESEIETIELKEDKKEGEKTEEINKEKEEKDLKTSAISKRMSVEAESKKEIGIDMEIEESPNKDKVPEIEYTPLVTGEVESKKIDIATSESKPIKTGVEAEPIDPASGEGKVNSAVETEVTIAPPSVDVSGPGSSSGVPVDCINDAGTPSVSRSSGFDIVKYAQKRLKIKRKQIKRMSMIQKQRNENIFFQAELYLSPYATNELTPDIEDRFLDNINDSFKRVILSIRTSERAKKIKIEEILKERERKEKERAAEREEVEFGFTFGKNSGLGTDNNDDDDDDDESDKDMDEVFPEFDFPTTNQPIIEERRKEDSTGIPEETLGFNSSVTTPGFTPATAPVEDDIEMEGSDLEDELTRAVTEERQIGVIGVNNVIEENDGDDDDDDDDDDVLFDDIVADSNMEAIVPKIEAVAKKSPSAQEQTQPRKDIPGTLEANSSDEDEFEDI